MSLLTPLVPAFPNNLTNGTPADASQVMADFNNLRNAINTVLNATGATGGDQYVGLTTDARFNGTSVHDALTQLIDRQSLYTDTGTTNAMVITPNPAMATLAAGQLFAFKPANTTTLNTATIAIGANTAVTFANQDGTTLPAGALIAGSYYLAYTAGPGNPVRVINPSRSIGSFTSTIVGGPANPSVTYVIEPDGDDCYFRFPAFTGTGSGTTFTMTVPSSLLSANLQILGPIYAEDATALVVAFLVATSSSPWSFFQATNVSLTGAWTAGGTRGMNRGGQIVRFKILS